MTTLLMTFYSSTLTKTHYFSPDTDPLKYQQFYIDYGLQMRSIASYPKINRLRSEKKKTLNFNKI